MIVSGTYDPPKVTSHTMSDGRVIEIAWTHFMSFERRKEDDRPERPED